MGTLLSKSVQTQTQVHAQFVTQAQLQDQALSFDNMMKLISTFQSLANKVEGTQKEKQLKAYDFHNYDWKDLETLNEQAKVQLYSFATSKYIFDSTYGLDSYQYSAEFPKDKLKQKLEEFESVFKKGGQEDCLEMIQDFKSILKSDYKIYYEKMQKLLSEVKQEKRKSSKGGDTSEFIEHLTKAEKHTEQIIKSVDKKKLQDAKKIEEETEKQGRKTETPKDHKKDDIQSKESIEGKQDR